MFVEERTRTQSLLRLCGPGVYNQTQQATQMPTMASAVQHHSQQQQQHHHHHHHHHHSTSRQNPSPMQQCPSSSLVSTSGSSTNQPKTAITTSTTINPILPPIIGSQYSYGQGPQISQGPCVQGHAHQMIPPSPPMPPPPPCTPVVATESVPESSRKSSDPCKFSENKAQSFDYCVRCVEQEAVSHINQTISDMINASSSNDGTDLPKHPATRNLNKVCSWM